MTSRDMTITTPPYIDTIIGGPFADTAVLNALPEVCAVYRV